MTATVPDYIPGLELSAAGREDALRLVDRVRALHRAKTTDQAEGTWVEPVANYLDPALFEAEKALPFARCRCRSRSRANWWAPTAGRRSMSPGRQWSSHGTPRAG